jgi:hypothetical protein
VRFGAFLPAYAVPGEAPPTAAFLQDYARRAEDVGFDSIWVFDHLFDAPPSYRVVFLEPVTTLAVVVPATRRVTVGTGILVLPLRDPVVTAKAFANLDVLSEGRVVFGAGVGWEDREFRACQVPKATRGRRRVSRPTRVTFRAAAASGPAACSPPTCARPSSRRSARWPDASSLATSPEASGDPSPVDLAVECRYQRW